MKSYLQFDEKDWERTERNWTAWWRGELDRPMVVIEAMARRRDRAGTWWDHITGFPLSVSAEAVIDHYAAEMDVMLWAGDAFPKWWPNFGPGIIAAFLGSRVDASTGTTWFYPSGTPHLPVGAGVTSLAEMNLAFSLDNPWWSASPRSRAPRPIDGGTAS